jgi:DNA end-binding protein Ku
VLLRRTLEQTDRTAIVHFALRQKTRLGALRVHGDVLMLQSLLWSDEVREATFPALDEHVRISAKELDMSSALVDSFASDFSPEDFTDDYQEQLRTLIDAKLEQGEALDTEATFGEQPDTESGGEVIDLMEALRRSVERNAAKKKPATASKKPAAKKAAAAKPGTAKPAAKPAAKKTAAKKSTAEKEPAAEKKRRA